MIIVHNTKYKVHKIFSLSNIISSSIASGYSALAQVYLKEFTAKNLTYNFIAESREFYFTGLSKTYNYIAEK